MNIFRSIYRFFYNPDKGSFLPTSPTYSKPVDMQVYTARILKEAGEKAIILQQNYGTDFNAFLYRRDLDTVIKQQIAPFLFGEFSSIDCISHDHWADKNPLNFPGPFYTGVTDNAYSGPPESPDNIFQDVDCWEFVGRQPHDYAELICTINAASADVFDGYACNGNRYWTIDLCREWWRTNPDKLRRLAKATGDQQYLEYLDTTAETDLRRYCYFLDNGHYPAVDERHLPDL